MGRIKISLSTRLTAGKWLLGVYNQTHQSEHHQSREWLNSGKEVHHVLAGFTS
jgi:hypothetical protein